MVVGRRLFLVCWRCQADDILPAVEAVVDAVGRRAAVFASAAVSAVFRIAFAAQTHAPAHRPIAAQAGQQDREQAEAAPARGPLVWNAWTWIVGATDRLALAAQLVILGTVVEQSLHTTHARRVVNDCLRRAEAVVIAEPLWRQRPRSLTLVALTSIALWTHHRVLLFTSTTYIQSIIICSILRVQNDVLGTMTKLLMQGRILFA